VDLVLLLELAMGLALLTGAFLAWRRKFRAHAWCQSVVVLLNAVLVALVMLPSFHRQVWPRIPLKLGKSYFGLATAHAALGAVVECGALYILLAAGTAVMPEKLRLTRRRDDPAGGLAYSDQRALEIGMALATNPEILLLDEPTAGMSREESAYTVALIRAVTEGKTLLVVEHDMSVVFTLCDQISVLVYGEIIASGEPEGVRVNPKVQEAYLGEEVPT